MIRAHSRALAALLVLISSVVIPAAQPEEEESQVGEEEMKEVPRSGEVLPLPPPEPKGTISLEESIWARRSVRSFRDEPLSEKQLSQLLWSAQGITDGEDRLRASPSAGALYPLELYVATETGLHHYEIEPHALKMVSGGDLRPALYRAALEQEAIRRAPAVFVIAAVPGRTAIKYGERSRRYVDMEVGHAAQNLLLQAVALGLGGVPIGAFHDDRVRRVLDLPGNEKPRYLIPVGRPR